MTISGEKNTRPPFPLCTKFPSTFERTGYKLYNYLDNSLYPIRPFCFGASVAASAAFYSKFSDRGLLQIIPVIGNNVASKSVRIGLASILTAYLPVVFSRFVLTHFYFTYKRWLFENPKKPSLTTKLWGIVRFLLSFAPPLQKSCDSLLPSMPVPVLEETVKKYLESVRQLHSKEELAVIEKMAENFLRGEGPKLQRYTKLYSLCVDNYVTGFWEKYAYLSTRSPLPINSSVCNLDQFRNRPATQAFRAAHIAYIEILSQLAIDKQHLAPPGGGIVCTRHYDRLYAVTRVPGKNVDCLKNYGIAHHIVVLYDGGIYKVNLVDENGKIFAVDQIADIFIELLNRPNTKVEGAEGKVPALTHDTRPNWHANRRRFFENIPQNAKALREIESSAFIISLNSFDYWEYDQSDPDKLSRFARSSLTGEGADRWVDKSINYNISRNGGCSGTEEHSVADGCELDHTFENYLKMENEILSYPPLEEQRRREKEFDPSEKGELRFAERIEIKVTEEMASEIDRVFTSHSQLALDVHMSSLIHRQFGKGRIKECACSPDAFVQMAIQLANYRDQGRFVLTYESASTRFFRNSRTETHRTTTDESCEFVRAMDDEKSERSDRAFLLRKACEVHSTRGRDNSVNGGIDRHLFVLYVMSKVPNMTNTTRKEDENPDQSYIGGIFAAVAKTGYGVCYRFAGNHSICVHISSFHSATNTNSDQFRTHLVKALEEMSELFD